MHDIIPRWEAYWGLFPKAPYPWFGIPSHNICLCGRTELKTEICDLSYLAAMAWAVSNGAFWTYMPLSVWSDLPSREALQGASCAAVRSLDHHQPWRWLRSLGRISRKVIPGVLRDELDFRLETGEQSSLQPPAPTCLGGAGSVPRWENLIKFLSLDSNPTN